MDESDTDSTHFVIHRSGLGPTSRRMVAGTPFGDIFYSETANLVHWARRCRVPATESAAQSSDNDSGLMISCSSRVASHGRATS